MESGRSCAAPTRTVRFQSPRSTTRTCGSWSIPAGTQEAFAKAHFPHAKRKELPDNRTIFDDVAEGHADVMVTDGAEVDCQARRHRGVLCPAADGHFRLWPVCEMGQTVSILWFIIRIIIAFEHRSIRC